MPGFVNVLVPALFAACNDSTRIESTVKSHGHKYNAMIVIDISRQLENVLVEQNHCHGLTTVMRSWRTC